MEEAAAVIERSGSSIHYWTAGPERSPLVVFTHDGLADHRMFDAQLATLWEAGYRTLRWDMRGHGRSQPLGKTPLTVRDLADDLLAVLDAITLGRPFCLVGQGLGGQVAQLVARWRPERAAALVLVATAQVAERVPVRRRVGWWWSRARLRCRDDGWLRHRVARAAALRRSAQTYAFAATDPLSRRHLVEILRATWLAAHPRPTYLEPSYPGTHYSSLAYVAAQPVLLLVGDHDAAGLRAARRWSERDPRCELVVVPYAGHRANQDNPTEFNHALVSFLAAHCPVPRGVR